MTAKPSAGAGRWYQTRSGRMLLALLAVGGAYLLVEHWAHVAGYLPWLLVLACPLMHVFMHRGHGHGRTGGDGTGE